MAARTPERIEFLSDIITSAIEGGTGYWAQVSQYQYLYDGEIKLCVGKRVPDAGARATIHDMEDDTSQFEIDIETIATGIARIKGGDFAINSQIRDWIIAGDKENDAGEIDADAADCIVQAGLFGELVYG